MFERKGDGDTAIAGGSCGAQTRVSLTALPPMPLRPHSGLPLGVFFDRPATASMETFLRCYEDGSYSAA